MAENWKQQRCFLVDEWMNKLLYLGNEILFGTKKKKCVIRSYKDIESP